MGFVLGILGVSRTIVSTVFQTLIKYPWQGLCALMLIFALFAMHNANHTQSKLVAANQTIATQRTYISNQKTILDQYVVSLGKERQTLAQTIEDNNKAVDQYKATGDKALASAQAAGLKAKQSQAKYDQLATKYHIAGIVSINGTCEQRITNEQNVTDQFIGDWRK